MIPGPPRSTLFPYTTPSDLVVERDHLDADAGLLGDARLLIGRQRHLHLLTRSEEHTSELQSLRHLVCRLLLEKKKNALDATLISKSHRHVVVHISQVLFYLR